jgi:methionyl-tRNA formyltransferase
MQMEAGLDTGPVLACATCPVSPLATSGDLYDQLAQLGPGLLLEVLNDLPAKRSGAQIQDDSLATYAAKIDKSEAQLNWGEPAAVLARRIRAFNPAPGCFGLLGNTRVKIWNARPGPGNAAALPGTILKTDAAGITVACGEGALVLERLQLPGAKALPVADVLRGKPDFFAEGAAFINLAH